MASATLTATPSTIAPGQSSVLTLTLPTADYHNIFINGVRPALTGMVGTLTVTPTVTTIYQSVATTSGGTPYAMPAVTVTLAVPVPPLPSTKTETVTVTYANGQIVTFGIQVPSNAVVVITGP